MTPRERAEAYVRDTRYKPANTLLSMQDIREVDKLEAAFAEALRAARAHERERCAGIVYRWSPASANTDAWLRERDLVIGEIRTLPEEP